MDVVFSLTLHAYYAHARGVEHRIMCVLLLSTCVWYSLNAFTAVVPGRKFRTINGGFGDGFFRTGVCVYYYPLSVLALVVRSVQRTACGVCDVRTVFSLLKSCVTKTDVCVESVGGCGPGYLYGRVKRSRLRRCKSGQ